MVLFLLVCMQVLMGTANKEKTRQPVLHRLTSKAGRHRPPRWFFYRLLILICAEQESGDLRSGAGGVRVKSAAAYAGSDAVFHGPCHSVCIVAIGGNIAELGLAIDYLTNGAEQESHALGAGAGGVRPEFTIACAGGNTVLHRPCDCLSIVYSPSPSSAGTVSSTRPSASTSSVRFLSLP